MASRFDLKEGWSALGLLILMLICVAWAIRAARWTDGLDILQWVVLGAVGAGLLLAKSRLRTLWAHTLGLLVGTAWVAWLTSGLLAAELGHRGRLLNLAERVIIWLEKVHNSEQSNDNLIFVLGMAFLIWLLGYFCAWYTFREPRIWYVVVPGGVILFLNVHYARDNLAAYFVFYLFFALLLVVRSNLYARQRAWEAAGVRYDPDIPLDFLRDGAIFAVVIILAAWAMPVTAASPRLADTWLAFEEPWLDVQDQWNRLFASLNYGPQEAPHAFGKGMILSGPVQLPDTLIMEVRAEVGRYWRAVVFDRYTGWGWIDTDEDKTLLDEGRNISPGPAYALRREVTQTITIYEPGGNVLLAAPQPVRVGLPARAEVSFLPSGDENRSPALDVSIIYSRKRLRRKQTYQVVSSLSTADVQSLRAAGDDYPPWVTERYRQLPSSLPGRVRRLARQITEGQPNAFDKATAIETYLRRYPYNQSIAAPPPDRDGVEYFLFDVKEGYCDYYASAMAVLARAAGIPTRLAAGYARGEYVPDLGLYRVRASHAHTWVEVFFPGYGWIEFEPTASEPPIARPERPSGEAPAGDRDFYDPLRSPGLTDVDREHNLPEDEVLPGGGTASGRAWSPVRWAGALAIGLVAVGAAAWWLRQSHRPTGLTVVEQVYERMVRHAGLIGLPRPGHQTPHEYAANLSSAVPGGAVAIGHITDLFVRERFGRRRAAPEEERAAQSDWRVLRRILWWRMLGRWLRPRWPTAPR